MIFRKYHHDKQHLDEACNIDIKELFNKHYQIHDIIKTTSNGNNIRLSMLAETYEHLFSKHELAVLLMLTEIYMARMRYNMKYNNDNEIAYG